MPSYRGPVVKTWRRSDFSFFCFSVAFVAAVQLLYLGELNLPTWFSVATKIDTTKPTPSNQLDSTHLASPL